MLSFESLGFFKKISWMYILYWMQFTNILTQAFHSLDSVGFFGNDFLESLFKKILLSFFFHVEGGSEVPTLGFFLKLLILYWGTAN